MEENMRNRFDRQLSTLNDELIEMGSMIEKSIETAIKALVNQDVDLARHAIEADEEIDRQERIIEDLCLKLLLQQQPGCKRFKTDFIRIKNDYGYGANRRPRFGYFRNHNCTGRPAVY